MPWERVMFHPPGPNLFASPSYEREEQRDPGARDTQHVSYMDRLLEAALAVANVQAVPGWRESADGLPSVQQGGACSSDATHMIRRVGPSSVEVLASCAAISDFMKEPELFDFRRDASEWRSKRFTVSCTMACIWKESRIMLANPSQCDKDAMCMLLLLQKASGFWIDPIPSCRTPWLVIRGLRYALAQGDVFRVGRFSFRVRQLVVSDSAAPLDLAFEETAVVSASSNEGLPCRICLQCGPDSEGQLIAPCDCRGSVEYVHVGCLQHWMRSRASSSEGKRAFSYKLQACELCKAPYPTHYTTSNGDLEPLALVDTPPVPYLVLEELSLARAQDEDPDDQLLQPERLGIHVASFAEGPIRLGRCRESDIEIRDDYVSRRHAVVRFEHGQFLLEDNRSKWGTLVALREEWRLDPYHPVSVQVGPAVLTLALQPHTPSTLSPRSQLAGGWGRPTSWPPGIFDMRVRVLWLSALLSEA